MSASLRNTVKIYSGPSVAQGHQAVMKRVRGRGGMNAESCKKTLVPEAYGNLAHPVLTLVFLGFRGLAGYGNAASHK